MIVSQAGIDLIKEFEGCRLEAYQDGAGIWTLGYGHTSGVKGGDTCTQEQADAWLLANIADAAASVQEQIDVPLMQGQFDALTSFVYNLGAGSLHGSTLRKLLNAGETAQAALEFPKWCNVAGAPSEGLLRRRLAEQAMFIQAPAVVS